MLSLSLSYSWRNWIAERSSKVHSKWQNHALYPRLRPAISVTFTAHQTSVRSPSSPRWPCNSIGLVTPSVQWAGNCEWYGSFLSWSKKERLWTSPTFPSPAVRPQVIQGNQPRSLGSKLPWGASGPAVASADALHMTGISDGWSLHYSLSYPNILLLEVNTVILFLCF